MAIELSNEEKLSIVNQHIKSVDYTIYGLELDLIETEAAGNPEPAFLSSLNNRITAANAKRAALVTERDSLTVPTE